MGPEYLYSHGNKKGHCILLHNKETVCSGLVLGNSMFAMQGGLSGMTHSCEEAHSGTHGE
jgi:hypothetical protein